MSAIVLYRLLPVLAVLCLIALTTVLLCSMRRIGPTEVGLVTKRFASRRLSDDNIIAFQGEAGYQADLLMPGLRWKIWPLYKVEKYPWIQVPAGEIGVVIAQVGQPLPIGSKSAVYKKEFANYSNVRAFVAGGGQKGVQRPVLSPGTLVPIHPVGFLVITKGKVYGLPVSPEFAAKADAKGYLMPESFGLRPEQLNLVRITPQPREALNGVIDTVGIVTTFEGDPLPSGANGPSGSVDALAAVLTRLVK